MVGAGFVEKQKKGEFAETSETRPVGVGQIVKSQRIRTWEVLLTSHGDGDRRDRGRDDHGGGGRADDDSLRGGAAHGRDDSRGRGDRRRGNRHGRRDGDDGGGQTGQRSGRAGRRKRSWKPGKPPQRGPADQRQRPGKSGQGSWKGGVEGLPGSSGFFCNAVLALAIQPAGKNPGNGPGAGVSGRQSGWG